MNDFTKEELEDIKYWCQLDVKLKDKIECIIADCYEYKHEWVDVKEKLPIQHSVIGFWNEGESNLIKILYFQTPLGCEGYFWDPHLQKKVEVTHWMNLPDAPE